jgi:DNA primase
MIEGLETINLVEVIEKATGQQGKRMGNKTKFQCCFHEDKDPSLVVYPDNRFHCFGCGAGFDALDFTQKFYGCDFKDALKMLGIESGRITVERQAEIQRAREERQLLRWFRNWERRASDEVATLCFGTRKVLSMIKNEADMRRYGHLYHSLENYQYHLEILTSNNDRAKLELFRSGIYA